MDMSLRRTQNVLGCNAHPAYTEAVMQQQSRTVQPNREPIGHLERAFLCFVAETVLRDQATGPPTREPE